MAKDGILLMDSDGRQPWDFLGDLEEYGFATSAESPIGGCF